VKYEIIPIFGKRRKQSPFLLVHRSGVNFQILNGETDEFIACDEVLGEFEIDFASFVNDSDVMKI
jgi:hypothetical protein